MRYVSFLHESHPTWGAFDGHRLYDLGATGSNYSPSLREAIASGLPDERHAVRGVVRNSDGCVYLPLVPDPGKILCVGMNYRSHQDEVAKGASDYPVIFTRFADTQIGHQTDALKPTESARFDYEGELAVVIGRDTFKVPEEAALSHVAGFSCYNDFSVRDWQKHTSQWTPGKNFPKTGAFGPHLVVPEDIGDIAAMSIETRVNGEVRQRARIGDLLFDIPRLISYVSTFTPLSAGDVIVTGTPGGVGQFMSPQVFLEVGDVVEVEISSVGTLTNRVSAGESVRPGAGALESTSS